MKSPMIMFVLLLGSTASWGAEISVFQGKQDVNGGDYEVFTHFDISYQDNALPSGSRVALVSDARFENCAPTGDYDCGSWAGPAPEPQFLSSVAPNTWKIEILEMTSQREKGLASYLEFAFRITLPDGEFYWDNGGRAPLGFYSSPLRPFGEGALSISALASPSDYPRN